jgi:hypothetical protein
MEENKMKTLAFPIEKQPVANLDNLTNDCVSEVSQRSGVSPSVLLQHIVRAWYEINFDVPASHLKAEIAQSEQDAAKWGRKQA